LFVDIDGGGKRWFVDIDGGGVRGGCSLILMEEVRGGYSLILMGEVHFCKM